MCVDVHLQCGCCFGFSLTRGFLSKLANWSADVQDALSRELQGRLGTWKQYLQATNAGRLKDPGQHSWEVMAAFLDTLTDPKHCKAIRRLLRWQVAVNQDEMTSKACDGQSGAEQEQSPPQKRRKHDHSCTGAATQATALPAAPPAIHARSAIMRPQTAWELVHLTAAHEQYQHDYQTFPSWERGWKRIPRKAADATQQPTLLAVDCEMVQSSRRDRELVKVAIVDQSGDCIYEELIKPRKRILDYRTAITGIQRKHLQEVTTRREHAQQKLLRLMADHAPVILVGHALHNDLQALQIDADHIIDTSKIFRFRGLSRASPRLTDLNKIVLGRELRSDESSPHNCAVDAAAAMNLTLHAMSHGCQEPLQPPEVKVSAAERSMLLMHGIPEALLSDGIGKLQAAVPQHIRNLLHGCSSWNAVPDRPRHLHLVFKSPKAALAAFGNLPGTTDTDSLGRRQKPIALRGGHHVKLREMAAHKPGGHHR
ncbi:hypothetical protein WJX73_008028 [Symbiochloris irregularis]|uniref:Exonuclease domain-containing protein n=1 Tax=Symbiochloris irregularis TaxID=706552 RepID=A0AAW1PKD2_9CHLO